MSTLRRWLSTIRGRFYRGAIPLHSLEPATIVAGHEDPHDTLRWIPSVRVARQSKHALFAHPPSTVTYRLTVPARAAFRAFVSLVPDAWQDNPDGVEFDVHVSSRADTRSTTQRQFSHPAHVQHHRRWLELRVDLQDFAHQEVDLTLSTAVPSGASAAHAWAVWGDPGIMVTKRLSELWPFLFARDCVNFLSSLFLNRQMIRAMVVRDIRSRYVGSFLGIFWSVIHPLTQLLVYYFVFSVVLQIRLGPEYGGTNFAIWLVAGLLLWMFFADVVIRSPESVVAQPHLISKMVFPTELLPFVNLASATVNHLIAIALFCGFLVIAGYGVSLRALLIFPLLLATGLFALGISWMLAALSVFLRDIPHIIGVFVNVWFFMTPIIYPKDRIPERFQEIYGLNPMLYAIEGYRWSLLGSPALDMNGLAYFLAVGLVTAAIGGFVFKKLKPAFADVL